MRRTILTMPTVLLSLAVLGVAASCTAVRGQTSGIREVVNKKKVNKQAPAECLAVFRAFFKYVQKAEPGIVGDEKAQARWLSRQMRKSLGEFAKRSGTPAENPDYPSNQTFLGVWNNPTTFTIVGSRHYDYHNAKNPDDDRAIIDVLYEWDENPPAGSLDNQYPGDKNLRSFVFVREDGAWKLDDVYTFSDGPSGPESLTGYFTKGDGR